MNQKTAKLIHRYVAYKYKGDVTVKRKIKKTWAGLPISIKTKERNHMLRTLGELE